MNTYYVYIMSNIRKVLYIGMTNNLIRRIYEHKKGLYKGFTKKYYCTQLVRFESSHQINEILNREKQLKNWNRKKKIILVEANNPLWLDLGKNFSTSH